MAGEYQLPAAVEALGFSVVEPTPDLVAELSDNIREPDRLEIWATSHREPREAIEYSLAHTRYPTAALTPEGRVLAIFGVATTTFIAANGCPWLIGSREVPRYRRPFMLASRKWMQEKTEEFRMLTNLVDARYREAIRWLSWLGFDILPPEPFGPDKMPFRRFKWEKGSV